MVVEFNVVGRIILSELLLTAVLPFRFALGGVRIGPLARQFYFFAGLWFFGAMATDVICHTPLEDVFRGWSKIIFFVLNFTSIMLLVGGNRQKIITFVFLLFIGSAIRLRMNLDGTGIGAEVFGSAWKFGYGQLLTACSLLLSAYLITDRATRLIGVSVPIVDAILNIVLNARNLFGLSALSALAQVFMGAHRRRTLSPAKIAAIGVAGAVVAWGLVSAYSYAASSGLIGLEAKEKYETQTSSSLGLILGGRAESLASTQAIIDSPIIGHGSWARDLHYVELLVTRLEQAGMEIQGDPFVDDLIPSHSHLLGAWVEAGVLGGVFWFWGLWTALRGLYAAIEQPTPFTGFVAFVGLSLLWDILFSPFGLDRRVTTAAWLVLMMITVETPPVDGKTRERSA
jgi:hypothetical protein